MSSDIDVRNMVWRPGLIRLTQIASPEIDDGKPTTLYIDPGSIVTIRRSHGAFNKAGTSESYPRISCTEVFFCHGGLLVEESPETVALLRDKAFGQAPKPTAVE